MRGNGIRGTLKSAGSPGKREAIKRVGLQNARAPESKGPLKARDSGKRDLNLLIF